MSTSLGNNGMERATQLVVDKKVGGISLSGFPHRYSLLDTFGNYAAVTRQELATMPVNTFKTRLSAFKVYVETIETGISVDTTGAYRENTTTCPYIKGRL